MFRGTTARALIALFSAALLALPFFAPATPFASAHMVRHAEAKAKTGKTVTGAALRDGCAPLHDCGLAGNPTGPLHPLRSRDRHRAVNSGPGAPQHSTLEEEPAAARAPAAPGAAHSRTARSAADRTPAALQVFRC